MLITKYDDLKEHLGVDYKSYKEVQIGENDRLRIRQYLPIDEKAAFIQYIVNFAVDNTTGCFSPVRVNVFYALALAKFYCGINFDDTEETLSSVYDTMETSNFLAKVIDSIPKDEIEYLNKMLEETIRDVARFNNSFVGMVSMMSSDATNLGEQLEGLLTKIKNKEGIELVQSMVENN